MKNSKRSSKRSNNFFGSIIGTIGAILTILKVGHILYLSPVINGKQIEAFPVLILAVIILMLFIGIISKIDLAREYLLILIPIYAGIITFFFIGGEVNPMELVITLMYSLFFLIYFNKKEVKKNFKVLPREATIGLTLTIQSQAILLLSYA